MNLKTLLIISSFLALNNILLAQKIPLNENYSNSRWATNEKALKGLDGSIDNVEISQETDSSLSLIIYFTGYNNAILKVHALTSSGSGSSTAFASSGRLNSSRNPIEKNIIYRHSNSGTFKSSRIELVLTNSAFRNKGHSYVYAYEKQWSKPDAGDLITLNMPSKRVNIILKPIGKAREEFLR